MNTVSKPFPIVGTFAILLGTVIAAVGQDAPALFYHGYYLQYERNDAEGALAAYEQALAANPSREIQQQVRRQIDRIQEDLVSHRPATLMPSETMAYVEISEPARHLENLVRSMGLTDRSPSDAKDPVTIALDEGFVLSSDFQISPALLAELKKVQGLAVGITGITDHGPTGLLVINPGKSDLLRGLLETGVQVVPRDESIGGHATYRLEDKVWIVQTSSLILCSTERAQVEKGLERIRRKGGASLADSKSFTEAWKEYDGALAFAFVDGPRLLTHLAPHLTGEAAAARLALDLDHLARVAVAISTDERGASAQARVTYEEGHHSLAYGLVRTEPFSSRALSQVPEGAALVAVVGVNPRREESNSQRDGAMYLTGLDIGRELFANIAEVSLFVLPSKVASGQDAPDFGLVVASNDAGKSDALWNQLLSLPASMGMKDGPQVTQTLIAGKHASTYTFDKHAPALTLMRWNADTLVAGTTQAITQLVESSKQGRSALNDPAYAHRIKDRGEHTSKAVFANIGRMLELASQMERNDRKAEEMKALKKVLSDLTLTWTSHETPTELAISVKASGLPLFEDIVRVVAGQQAGKSSARVASTESNAR